MKTIDKLAVGAGTCLLVGAVGYCAYKYFKARDDSAAEEIRAEDDENEEISDEDEKIPLADLMDCVLLDVIPRMLVEADAIKEVKYSRSFTSEESEAMREGLEIVLTEMEQKTCKDNNWDPVDYENEMIARQEEKDGDVIKRVDALGQMVQSTLSGERPKISFKFDPRLTPDNAFILYAWILLTHCYTAYVETRNAIARDEHLKMNEIEFGERLNKIVDITREQRR